MTRFQLLDILNRSPRPVTLTEILAAGNRPGWYLLAAHNAARRQLFRLNLFKMVRIKKVYQTKSGFTRKVNTYEINAKGIERLEWAKSLGLTAVTRPITKEFLALLQPPTSAQ